MKVARHLCCATIIIMDVTLLNANPKEVNLMQQSQLNQKEKEDPEKDNPALSKVIE